MASSNTAQSRAQGTLEKETIKEGEVFDEGRLDTLCVELAKLVSFFAKIRGEIAMLYAQQDEHTLIESMQRQLKSVLIKSEAAANETISIFEDLATSCDRLKKAITDGNSKEVVVQIQKIHGFAVTGLENATLQDVIRQRVAGIAMSMTYIDARLERIVSLVGKDKVSEIAQKIPPFNNHSVASSHSTDSIGQTEIDKMFP